MSAGITSLPRRVIPRWRDFKTAVLLNECNSITASPPSNAKPAALADLLQQWNQRKTIALAGEILSEAVVTGHHDIAADVTKYLVANRKDISPLMLGTAEWLFASSEQSQFQQSPLGNSRSEISSFRRALRSQPYDPIGWCELARLYSIKGEKEKARRSMQTAIALGGASRYILRSATRYFLHADEPDTAFIILQRSPRAKTDPWIVSAAIATASILGKRPNKLREAIRLSQDTNIPLYHRAELLASIATVHLDSGSYRHAAKDLQLALQSPTENVVAQACWASLNKHLKVTVSEKLLSNPFTHEANTFTFMENEKWEDALRASHRWLNDEEFAGRPAIQAAFIRSAVYDDFAGGESILLKAANTNPNDNLILNNIAFCLASENKTREALRAISGIDPGTIDRRDAVCLTATCGLIEFREGRHAAGRDLYKRAIQMAQINNFPRLRTVALYYLAREEGLAGTDLAEDAKKTVLTHLEKQKDLIGNLLKQKITSAPPVLPNDLIL